MYLPDGATVRRLLERYIQDKEIKLGYMHVYTPSLANTELYKIRWALGTIIKMICFQ